MADKKIQFSTEIARRADILTTDLDGEISMFDVETGKYYTLDPVSSDIWNLIEKPTTVQQLVAALLKEYEIDEATCTEHTLVLLNQLHDRKLIHTFS